MIRNYQPSVLRVATLTAVLAGTAFIASAQYGPYNAVSTTTVTNASGLITQVNYNASGGSVQSFLVGTSTILSFPTTVCAGVASLGVAGNSVTYSGTAFTFSSGYESVSVTSFTNNTTKATYTEPSPVKPTTYGPTAGVVSQLNYDTTGAVDGFLFTPTGSKTELFIYISPRPKATLAPLLKVSAAVAVAGVQEPPAACAPAGTVAQIDVVASSLTFGTTTVTVGPGSGFGFGH